MTQKITLDREKRVLYYDCVTTIILRTFADLCMAYRVCITCYEACELSLIFSILRVVVLEKTLDICTRNETVGNLD